MLALGTAADGFAAWRGDASGASGWRAGTRFGSAGPGAVAGVESVAVLPDTGRVLAATTAQEGHRLWSGDLDGQRWRPVDLPARVPANGASAQGIAGRAGTALLLTDDGTTGGAWVAPFSGL
jgi:hypothetical protein